MAKTILVTGGAGFIGSHLINKLMNSNSFVYCIDNLSTGSINNISEYLDNKYFKFIQHDIINPLPDIKVDQIFHLACPASPIQYQIDPINTMKTSVLGTYNVINLAILNKSKILYSSTSEIYGNPIEHPQKETYFGNVNTIGERSCYDEGKRCAETILSDYKRFDKIDACIVRIFNTYGPNMSLNDGRVISNFIVNALLNKDIIINGDGKQTRSFCYIDDLIDSFDNLLNNNMFGPVNIGNPNEIKIIDLCKMVVEITNSKSKVVFKNLPEDDPIRRKPDISIAKNSLNWEPKISLENGLKLTIDYFEKLLKNESNTTKDKFS